MARKKLVSEGPNLEELIPIYGEQNAQCNALKKVVADLNSKIKAEIKKAEKTNQDIIVGDWKCSLTVDDSFNDEKLIEFCKTHNIDVVRTKEYVDAKELERLMYNGLIPKDIILEMDKCKDIGSKETLRCTKIKKKEAN